MARGESDRIDAMEVTVHGPKQSQAGLAGKSSIIPWASSQLLTCTLSAMNVIFCCIHLNDLDGSNGTQQCKPCSEALPQYQSGIKDVDHQLID